jgi:hypothetical protein
VTVDVHTSKEPDDSTANRSPASDVEPDSHNSSMTLSPSSDAAVTVDQSPEKSPTQLITPEAIRPYPKAPPRKITNRRRLGKSRIATDTPVKNEMEQERLSRKRKGHEAAKPRSQARRKVFECGGPSDDACSTNVAVTSSSSNRGKKKCSRPTPKKAKKSSECDAACLYCGDLWSTSSEAFIQCQGKCNEWAHVSCAGVGKEEKNFTCERC